MARQAACVFFRRVAWHSGLRQARCRLPIRGSGTNHCRQIVQGLFRERAMMIQSSPNLSSRQPWFRLRMDHFSIARLSGSLLVSTGGSFLESAEALRRGIRSIMKPRSAAALAFFLFFSTSLRARQEDDKRERIDLHTYYRHAGWIMDWPTPEFHWRLVSLDQPQSR